MRWTRVLAALLLAATARTPLFPLLKIWLASTIYDGIVDNDPGEWRVTAVDMDRLWLGKYDPPLLIGDGMMLTAIEGDRLGRTALVDVKAKRNHIFAEETCEIRIRASCSRPLFRNDAIVYGTKCCEGEKNDSVCTDWAESTALRKSLRKGQTAVLTGWCQRAFIPLARRLKTSWYRDNSGKTTKLYTITTFTSTYHSWLVSCK
jgi:hypothetical protein